MDSTTASCWRSRSCFVPDVGQLFQELTDITMGFPGWDLTTVKKMARRERHYWIEFLRWRMETLANARK